MSTARRAPRILYVSEAWTHGAQVRCLSVLRALQEVGDVAVVMLGDAQGARIPMMEVGREAKIAYFLETQLRPNTNWAAKLKFTVDPRTHYPYGRGVDHDAMRRFSASVKEFDLVWFFKQRSADMFPNQAWERSVVDIDDLQSSYESATLRTPGSLARIAALRGRFIWRRRERLLGDRFTVLTVCSGEDKDYLRRSGIRGPIHVIPNGFDKPSAEPARGPVTPPRIGFIGGFDHFPNREGMAWFISECWPVVKREVPGTRLRLIGRDSEKFPELCGPDVDRLGSLADPNEEMTTWSSMIVPIRLGAGTRVKIAHGFSRKCPIVSTSLGAFGYGVVDEREIYLADSSSAFSSACLKTILDPEAASQIAQRAWVLFLEKWSWEAIRPRIWAAAEECLRASRSVSTGHSGVQSFGRKPQTITE